MNEMEMETNESGSKREREIELNSSTVEPLKNARSIFSHFLPEEFVFRVSFLLDIGLILLDCCFSDVEKRQQ